jgi:hypothetical protein
MRITREKRPSMALPVVGLIMTCGASLGLLAVSEYRPADRQVRLLLLQSGSSLATSSDALSTPDTVSNRRTPRP